MPQYSIKHETNKWGKPVCLLLAGVLLFSGCSSGAAPAVAPTATTAAQTDSPAPPTASPTPSPTSSPTPEPTPTPTPAPTVDPWAEHFSDTPVVEITNPRSKTKAKWVYKDKNLSITVSMLIRNSNRENYVAEIYSRGLTFFNAPANPKNAKAVNKPWYIARQSDAVFGISSDYWSFTRLSMIGQKLIKKKRGAVIRSGVVLADEKENETLAVMPDGELKVFGAGEVNAQQLLDMGVKDTYSFGPLLVRDGAVNPDMADHVVYKTINKPNTRCSIGMVEPGHYFVIISRNISFDQLAQIHLELGSKLAYNLDGGNSAAMVFMGEQINAKIFDESLKTGQRSIPDLICIGTSDKVPGVKDPVNGAANSD